jgi:hypothetical protein
VSEWVFFMHPPRDDFIATMTDTERSAFDAHAGRLRTLLADGVLIMAGPRAWARSTLGSRASRHPTSRRRGASLPMSQ